MPEHAQPDETSMEPNAAISAEVAMPVATTQALVQQACPCPRIETANEKAFIAFLGSLPGFVAALLVVGIGYLVNSKLEDRKHRNEELRLAKKLTDDRNATKVADARKRCRDALQSVAASAESAETEGLLFGKACYSAALIGGELPNWPKESLAKGEAVAQVYASDEVLAAWDKFDSAFREFANTCMRYFLVAEDKRGAQGGRLRPADFKDHLEIVENMKTIMMGNKILLHKVIRAATKEDRDIAGL